MNLVGYTATALSRNDITDTPKDKNVVSGAIVELKTLQGDLVTIYDDAAGANPETQKTCDSDGQCTFYAEAGDYNLEINGKPQKINLFFNKDKVNDVAAWGERFVGYFVDGFTYTKADDVAKGVDGKYYSYSGASAYPVVVTAGTVPSEPEYTAVALSEISSNNVIQPSSIVISGVNLIEEDITLSGAILLIDGVIQPANGVTVRIGSECKIISNGEWRDTSLGGVIIIEPGAYEERIIKNTSVPTSAFTVNIGWPDNDIDITSGGSFVRGGTQSFPHSLGSSSQLCVIDGAYDNWIGDDCIASSIHGGAHHRVHDGASHVGIMSGSYQESFADYVTLGGGTQNKGASIYGGVFTGQSNEAGDPAWTTDQDKLDNRSSAVLSGALNKARARRSGIGSGLQNLTSGFESWIGSGTNNTASGERSTVLAGNNNTASGNDSLAHGVNCTASAQSSISIGQSNISSDVYAVSFGESTEASAPAAMATGQRSNAYLRGQIAHASGYFARKGDAQFSRLTLRKQTSSVTTTLLGLYGGAQYAVMPDNTTWIFTIDVVGRSVAGDHAVYKIEGICKRDVGVATVDFVGTPVVTQVFESNTAYNTQALMNTTNGSLDVSVTTANASVTNWVAMIDLVEVGV